MSLMTWCRVGMRRELLGVALLLILPDSICVAQSESVLGYVAAKNASPKRLEGFSRLLKIGPKGAAAVSGKIEDLGVW